MPSDSQGMDLDFGIDEVGRWAFGSPWHPMACDVGHVAPDGLEGHREPQTPGRMPSNAI